MHEEELRIVQAYIREIIDPVTVKVAFDFYKPHVDDPKSIYAFYHAILMDAGRNFLVGNRISTEENGAKIFNVCSIPMTKKEGVGDIILEIAKHQYTVRVVRDNIKYTRMDWLMSTPYRQKDIIDYTILPKADEYPRW